MVSSDREHHFVSVRVASGAATWGLTLAKKMKDSPEDYSTEGDVSPVEFSCEFFKYEAHLLFMF